MTDLPRLKANEKLPRGSYFYIQVGSRFYAGEEAETQEVKEVYARPPRCERRGNRFGPVRDNFYGWGGLHGRTQTRSRVKKDSRLKRAAKYIQPDKTEKKEPRKEFTGRLHVKFVDEFEKAKHYRSKKLVDSACERLKTLYTDSGVKVSIRFKGAG